MVRAKRGRESSYMYIYIYKREELRGKLVDRNSPRPTSRRVGHSTYAHSPRLAPQSRLRQVRTQLHYIIHMYMYNIVALQHFCWYHTNAKSLLHIYPVVILYLFTRKKNFDSYYQCLGVLLLVFRYFFRCFFFPPAFIDRWENLCSLSNVDLSF